MDKQEFSELLLSTVFSIMACDGNIDSREVDLIIDLDKKKKFIGVQNIESRLNDMIDKLNQDSQAFLRKYFNTLANLNLTADEEKQLVGAALAMIDADDNRQYSELRFFKIIHSYLNITGEQIAEEFPEIRDIEDYTSKDIISEKYIESLTGSYFEDQPVLRFDPITVNQRKPSGDN